MKGWQLSQSHQCHVIGLGMDVRELILGSFRKHLGSTLLTGISKLEMCKLAAARGHLCHHIGRACWRVKPNTQFLDSAMPEHSLPQDFSVI